MLELVIAGLTAVNVAGYYLKYCQNKYEFPFEVSDATKENFGHMHRIYKALPFPLDQVYDFKVVNPRYWQIRNNHRKINQPNKQE